MKLYNSNFAPNPRRVRIFLAEKGLSIPRIEVDLGKLEHKTRGILGPQSLPDHPRSRTRRRDEDRRIDRDLPLHRGTVAGAEPVRRDAARTGDGRDVAAPLELRLLLPIAQVVAPHPSAHGGNGEPAGSRLGRGQPPEGAPGMAIVDERPARPAVHRRRPLHRRRHHRAGRARLRPAGAHRDPAGIGQSQPLACRR